MKKEEEKEMKKEEKREKRVEIQENGEQLMINLNEAKLMNEENWIETTNCFLPFSFVSAFLSFSFLFYCLLHFRFGNLFSYFANFFISFFKFFLIFVIFVEEETEEKIFKIEKRLPYRKCRRQ